jgi:MFS transporter, DHA2 family, metal-tetracycline-proton antiporter
VTLAPVAEERSISTRLFLTVLVIAILNSVLTGSMVNVLLSEIRETFHVSTAALSWVIAAYSLMYAIGIPLFGRISDFIGTRTLFIAGLSFFALGSLISALAPSFPVLIFGRLIQGAGGAAVPALSMVMIARVMPAESRGSAMGITASAVGVGSAIGPLVGGSIGDSIGWRFLFIAPVVVSIVIVLLARRALPNTWITDERHFDAVGAALLAIAIGLSLFGITQGQSAGYGAFEVVASFLGAIIAATVFVWRINTASYPFVPPSLFRNGPYVRLLAAGIFNMMAYLSSLILVPLMLVEHNGLTPTEAGLALTPGAVALAVGARYAGRISDRIGSRIPIITGLVTMLGASIFLSSVAAGEGAWVVATGVFFIGAGSSMISAPMSSTVSRLLTPEETGIGMGLFSGSSFMGGGIGAAITGAWLNARQDANAPALNPFYNGDAGPWSDAFLAVVVMVMIALAIATAVRLSPPTAPHA